MVRIIADSASDITQEEAKKLGIKVLPLKTRFGDEEYKDGIDISPLEFYNKLIESDVLPKTSQVTPFEYEEAFNEFPDDDILCITLSKKLSGTYQSAIIASEEMSNVYVLDSENVTLGLKCIIRRAVELRDKGLSVDEIVKIIDEEKKNVRVIALLDTLEYLKKGGRISAATAIIGGILNIKPVVEVRDGLIEAIGKARGSKNGNNKLREKISEYGGIDFDYPYEVAYSGLDDELLKKYLLDSADLYHGEDLPTTYIGAVIGTYVGPGAIGVAFFSKNNK